MTITTRLAAAAFASLFLAGTALAQTPAPAPKAKTEAATKTDTATQTEKKAEKKAQKPRSTESLACSKQADEKGLHGKERKKFRSECMKTAKSGETEKAK